MKINIKKKLKSQWTLPLFLLTMLCIMAFLYKGIATTYPFLNTAGRWQGNSKQNFNEYAVFFSADEKVSGDDIENFRQATNLKLSQEMSFEKDAVNKKWIDCYFAKDKVSVKTKHNSFSVQTYGIGGDYFFFNPLELKYGSYISEKNISKNMVVLDETAAWGLYGSADIVGQKILLAGKQFIVSGVLKSENLDKKSKDYTGTMFLDYKSLQGIKDIKISSYQAVLPEPIKDYGKNILNDNFHSEFKEIVKITDRFKPINIMKKLFDVESFIVKDEAVAYPYFENVTRIIEFRLINILKIIIFLIVCILVNLIFLIRKNKFCVYLYFSNLKVVQYVQCKFKKYNKSL